MPSVVGSGRPRIFCEAACRREMIRLRIEVGHLEEALAIARGNAQTGFWPGEVPWRNAITRLNRELRARFSRTKTRPSGVSADLPHRREDATA
ncbi:MAG: hypothetical protein ABI578_06895 [Chloroflexota bacterium]